MSWRLSQLCHFKVADTTKTQPFITLLCFPCRIAMTPVRKVTQCLCVLEAQEGLMMRKASAIGNRFWLAFYFPYAGCWSTFFGHSRFFEFGRKRAYRMTSVLTGLAMVARKSFETNCELFSIMEMFELLFVACRSKNLSSLLFLEERNTIFLGDAGWSIDIGWRHRGWRRKCEKDSPPFLPELFSTLFQARCTP